MDFLANYGLFLLKALTIVIALLLTFVGILALGKKPRPKLQIIPLNKDYDELKQRMSSEIKDKKLDKPNKKERKKDKEKPTLFVLEFNGDMRATQVEQLREAITATLSIAEEKDEVLLQLDSPGGVVNGYGLAASQVQRIRDKNIRLTVCIDKMAASGGYLMACIANEIVAAPFAYIGSIGVVSQIPNLHRWLKKNDIDVELITAGEYKRTLTLLGENTEKGREKMKEDLEKIHTAFRNFVVQNRQKVDIDEVATGEYWLATDAYQLKLVDKLQTSDAFLIEKMKQFNAVKITVHQKQSFAQKLLRPAVKLVNEYSRKDTIMY